jgi:hypothetical protein
MPVAAGAPVPVHQRIETDAIFFSFYFPRTAPVLAIFSAIWNLTVPVCNPIEIA